MTENTPTTYVEPTDPSFQGIVIERDFAAPRHLVFDAWTTPAHFAKWWGGSQVEVPVDSVVLDARAGGTWKATMLLDGGNRIDWVGEYSEVERPSHIRMTISDGSPEREHITIHLTETADGTHMVFSQGGGHLDAEQYEQVRAGYGTFFDAMDGLF